MKRKFKLPFIPTLTVVVILAAALLWWVNPSQVLAGFQVLPISLRSPLNADYSVDPRFARIKPLQLGIIEEAISDRQAAANAEQIIEGLNVLVPTITPMPGGNPNNPPVLPTLLASMTPTAQGTAAVTSVSPTMTWTITPTASATFFTATNTLPVLTQWPTNTSVVRTNTPISRTNTPQPRTNTPQPPTFTPIPPTNTAIPPTRTPIPPTRTSGYPPPPTKVPTSGPTAYP